MCCLLLLTYRTCRLQTPTTSRHALLDFALLPRFNSSVWCNSSWPRDPFARRLWLRPVRPGWHAPARRRIEAESADNDSLHFDSILSGGLFGILEPVRRFAAHSYHGAFTLRLTCPDGCRSALASGAVLYVLSYYCHTYGVGAYSHHETDHNLADGRAIKKTRSLREPQGHQGRSTNSNLYRHRTGSGGQVT
jgi:hypothetical protein